MGLEDFHDNRPAKQNIDQYSKFLLPTIPKGQFDYYNSFMALIGKETSTGNIFREDMMGHIPMVTCIIKLTNYGQLGLSRRFTIGFLSELNLTRSFDARFLEIIGSNKLEYTQEQHIYEHPAEEIGGKKKGIFGGFLGGR
jgi:hypothetical protein